MKILELKGIRHIYNDKKILDVPTLSIEKGKIYGIVGPNGAGKTTLLSIMALILYPTCGEFYFEGARVCRDSKSLLIIQRSMTMVLQNPYLFNMSIAKNIAYGLRARGIPKKAREAKIKETLELVGLDGFEKRKAREISGGETQLVALARALVLDPVILFLDEPTANIDSRHVRRFEDVIIKINKERRTTIVMTTHNLSQAYQLTESVFSLYNGLLINSTMHNLFSGKIRKVNGGLRFDAEKICIWVPHDTYNSNSTHVAIDPEDIIVSKEPFVSSARNMFEGIVTQIIDQGGKIFLEVRSQEILQVLITERSFQKMDLNIGAHVYLTFKASSVHIL